MAQTVMVTGCGRNYALGYNLALRYLENGDRVIASVRKDAGDIKDLEERFGDSLIVAEMDIGSTESVGKAFEFVSERVSHIDILINNAVTVSKDCDKDFFDVDLDLIAHTVDVTGIGPLRVIKAFYPLLKAAEGTACIYNISSEAGSISKCYRTNMIDYGIAKAALNMGTMNLYNVFKDDPSINIFAIHPGWIRTDGRENNPAPLSSYEAAGILRDLFRERMEDREGHRFITNEGIDYPF